MANKELAKTADTPDEPKQTKAARIELATRESQLTLAVRQLLDALDRCAGDPPDCPHCGPARVFADSLLNPEEQPNNNPASERERVSLSGRVGSDPSFRTTPKGTLVARFPLAVHGADNSTTWFPVLAFNQRAEQLKDFVKRGMPLDVVGYLHTREARSRNGTPTTIREVYAVTVTTPGAKR